MCVCKDNSSATFVIFFTHRQHRLYIILLKTFLPLFPGIGIQQAGIHLHVVGCGRQEETVTNSIEKKKCFTLSRCFGGHVPEDEV